MFRTGMAQDMLIEEEFQFIREEDISRGGKGDMITEESKQEYEINWSRLTIMQENDNIFNNSNRRSMLKFKNFDSYIHENH